MGGASLETKRQREHEVRSLPTRSMLRVLRALSPVLCPAVLAVDQQERGNSRITPSQPKTEVQKIFKKINKCSWNTVSGSYTNTIQGKAKTKHFESIPYNKLDNSQFPYKCFFLSE